MTSPQESPNHIRVDIEMGMITKMEGEHGYKLPDGIWRFEVVPTKGTGTQAGTPATHYPKFQVEHTPDPIPDSIPIPDSDSNPTTRRSLRDPEQVIPEIATRQPDIEYISDLVTEHDLPAQQLVKNSYIYEDQPDIGRATLMMLRALYQQQEEHMEQMEHMNELRSRRPRGQVSHP